MAGSKGGGRTALMKGLQGISIDEVFIHEKKQKLFKYARDKDHQDDLRAELEGITDRKIRSDLCREKDERQNTALHYAAKAGNLATCEFLVDQGADIRAAGQNKMTPLQFAARYGDVDRGKEVWECMKWIMEEEKRTPNNEKEVHCDGRDDFNILQHAIQNTNWEEDPVVLWELIKTRKFKISDPDKQGLNTSLHLAAQFDRQDDHTLLEQFLKRYEEVDENGQRYIDAAELRSCITAENLVKMTPLHVACAVGNPDSVEQILDYAEKERIDVSGIINKPDSNGSLPLSLAITSKNLNMVKILMVKGAMVDKEAIITAARSLIYC